MSFTLEGVGFTHANGHRALAGVDLRVAAGERVALIGASSSKVAASVLFALAAFAGLFLALRAADRRAQA